MPCCQMGSEMVLGGSAPSPYPGHSPASREIQHPAKELNSVCNLKENSCGRELTMTEDDSQSSLIQLLKKKKEAREMEKAMAEKEEVRKMGGCWCMVGMVCGFLEAFWEAGDRFWVQAAMSPSLWCCQAFRGRMKVITDRWRDLHAKRAQLKAHVEKSGRAVQVHQMTLSCTTNSSPPLGLGPALLFKLSVETGAVRNRTGRAQGFVSQIWKTLIGLGWKSAYPVPERSPADPKYPPGKVLALHPLLICRCLQGANPSRSEIQAAIPGTGLQDQRVNARGMAL